MERCKTVSDSKWWCNLDHLCVNIDKSVVNIYDSKYSTLIMTTVDVILELMKPEKGAVTINSINMQQQRGDDACGVFVYSSGNSTMSQR